MTNSYFNHDNRLTRHTLGRAESVNGIFDEIVAAFDLLPDADDFGENQYIADTGAANAYVVTLDPDPLSYYEGLRLLMKAANANTGASTINANGIGVKTMKRYNGDDLQANDITAGMIVYLIYDGTNFRIVSAHGADVALAQSWASSTSVVSGGLKGARGYAQDASTSASAAATSASNASTSASSASSSASSASSSAASALSQYQGFIGIYYGALSSDPALDPLGNPLGAGDLYWNTSTNRLRVYSGSAWGDAATVHTHAASDITSGTLDDARLATSGSFTGTLTGCTTTPTVSCRYTKVGKIVFLSIDGFNVLGTSNSSAFSMTGLPAAIRPVSNVWSPQFYGLTNNGALTANTNARINAGTDTVDFLLNSDSTGWTSSGNKGIGRQFGFAYSII